MSFLPEYRTFRDVSPPYPTVIDNKFTSPPSDYYTLVKNSSEIKTSTLPNAGLGWFVHLTIPKDTCIGYYEGKVVTEEEYYKLTDEESSYVAHIANLDLYVVAELGYSNHSRYPNDHVDKSKINIEFGKYGSIWTTKDIVSGEELFLDYGPNYWSNEDVERMKVALENQNNNK